MHLLTCPECETAFPVANSQAGQHTACPHCNASIDVPTLGQLRRLPEAEETRPALDQTREPSGGGSAGFLVFGLIATAALVVGSFCGIRWAMIDVPMTTEAHIAGLDQAYNDLSAAQLIREYEQMEELSIDLRTPYVYKQIEIKKSEWGRTALISAIVGVLAIGGAVIVAATSASRRKQS